jgi:hypothetical protein
VATTGWPRIEVKENVVSVFEKFRVVLDAITCKNCGFDVPPPGPGLNTLTDAVLATATSEDRMSAVTCKLETKCVVRALPFQFTTEDEMNPEPFTLRVKLALPGATADGTSG